MVYHYHGRTLFGADYAEQLELDVRQHTTRMLLERLIVDRPHP